MPTVYTLLSTAPACQTPQRTQIPEHTWGLPNLYDNGNWTNAQFNKARSGINYLNAQSSWNEQRYFNDLGIQVQAHYPPAQYLTHTALCRTPHSHTHTRTHCAGAGFSPSSRHNPGALGRAKAGSAITGGIPPHCRPWQHPGLHHAGHQARV